MNPNDTDRHLKVSKGVMHAISVFLGQHGVGLVFANVLLQQAGVPVPAEPTLVIAGSLAAQGLLSPAALIAVGALAALLADTGWFFLGRRYQFRLLAAVARLFRLTGDVDGLRESFSRWGLKSLLVAKFVPGVSQLLVPIAGASGVRFRAFLAYDLVGALAWTTLPVAAGMVFHQQVDAVLTVLTRVGIALAVVVLGLAGVILLSRRGTFARRWVRRVCTSWR